MSTPKDSRKTGERNRDGGGDRREHPDPRDPAAKPDPKAGLDREVGDLEDPDAADDGALPGRAGGGLAGD